MKYLYRKRRWIVILIFLFLFNIFMSHNIIFADEKKDETDNSIQSRFGMTRFECERNRLRFNRSVWEGLAWAGCCTGPIIPLINVLVPIYKSQSESLVPFSNNNCDDIPWTQEERLKFEAYQDWNNCGISNLNIRILGTSMGTIVFAIGGAIIAGAGKSQYDFSGLTGFVYGAIIGAFVGYYGSDMFFTKCGPAPK